MFKSSTTRSINAVFSFTTRVHYSSLKFNPRGAAKVTTVNVSLPSITIAATRFLSTSLPKDPYGNITPANAPEQKIFYREDETTKFDPYVAKYEELKESKDITYDVNVDVIVKQYHDDGLPRFPEFDSANGLLRLFDWVGTVSFAMTGTITAGCYGMDLLGCVLIGTITATGGGTIRDMFLGNTPVSFLLEVEYLAMCVITALLTFFLWKEFNDHNFLKVDGPLLWWTDTLGIGAFAVIGAQNGIRRHMHPLACIACGLFTATFGGVTRDVLVKLDVRIMHSHAELYATPAIIGSSTYCAVKTLGGTPAMRIVSGMATAILSRYIAHKQDIRLPRAPWLHEYPQPEPKQLQ